MASIGDLIMRVVAETKGFATQIVKDSEKAGDKAGKGFSQRFAKASKVAGGAKGGILQGLGLGVGLGVFSATTAAISGVIHAVGDMVEMAKADQVSQAQLRASLKANIPAWDGDTTAIEKNIKAKQRLGFEDEDERESMSLLVAATHDVAKARELLNTAEDLARFKRISLQEASVALVKVEAGQYKMLKSLGIVLAKGATQQDALNAVQKVAAGQAEAYAETVEGKQLVSQIKLNEAMEDLGTRILPLVADAAGLAADAIDGATGATRDNIQALEAETAGVQKNGATVEQIADLTERLAQAKKDALANPFTTASEQDSLNRSLYAVQHLYGAIEHTGQVSSGVQGNLRDMGKGLIALTHNADDSAVAFRDWSARVIESSAEVRRRLTSDMDALIDDVFDEEINRDRLAAQNAEIAAAKRILASGKASAAEKRDARATLHSVAKDREQTLQELATHGDLSQKEIAKHLKDLKHDYKNSTGDARIRIGKLIDKWKELQRLGNKPITLTVATQLITANAAKPRGGHRAAGGPVRAGVPYVVGEYRPEVFVPEVNGRIQPRVASAPAGSGGGLTIPLHIEGMPLQAETPVDVVRALRRASHLGVLPRRGRPAPFRKAS